MYLALVNRLIGWVGGSSATPPSCSQGGGIHGNSLISWKRMEESEEIDNVHVVKDQCCGKNQTSIPPTYHYSDSSSALVCWIQALSPIRVQSGVFQVYPPRNVDRARVYRNSVTRNKCAEEHFLSGDRHLPIELHPSVRCRGGLDRHVDNT